MCDIYSHVHNNRFLQTPLVEFCLRSIHLPGCDVINGQRIADAVSALLDVLSDAKPIMLQKRHFLQEQSNVLPNTHQLSVGSPGCVGVSDQAFVQSEPNQRTEGRVSENWRLGSGTIIVGPSADKAKAAVLGRYPSGTVNRVLKRPDSGFTCFIETPTA